MGLDMYLTREIRMDGEMKITDKNKEKMLGKNMRSLIRHDVAYWRKFNALHKYFNDHFNNQDNDNCVDMDMGIDDIRTLLKLVQKIKSEVKTDENGNITNRKVCAELPTEEGFFFGSTEYDADYVYQLDETIRQLTKVVEEHEKLAEVMDEFNIDYYYHAWY